MKALKRTLTVVTTALSVAGVLALSVGSFAPASSPLRALGSGIARAMAGVRPAALAPTDAAATEFLPPIAITVGPDVTLQDKLTLTGTVTISCGPFISTSSTFTNIQITEPSGSGVAHAFASVPAVICDGAPHTFGFTATASDAPFHPSTGQEQVFVSACGTASDFTFQCESGQTIATTTIKR